MRSTSRSLFVPLTALLALACTALGSEQTLQLDTAQTVVNFTLGDVLHTVHGTFKLKRGTVGVDRATGKASGQVVVDVASGDSGGKARDRRMHKEILESQRYPDAVFVPDRFEGSLLDEGASDLKVHGTMTMHGSEHELIMTVKTQASHGRVTADIHFVIPYVAWGMKDPSNFLLKVNNEVEMDIKAVGEVK